MNMLSIIIPTLNSGRNFQLLLDSINSQGFKDYEIIVCDGGSRDDTIQIAKRYDCKIVKGGIPAKGRNQGAAEARGELLLFLDAETFLPEGFLENLIKTFKAKKLDLATCAHHPIKEDWMPRFFSARLAYDLLYNWPAKILEKVFPFSSGLILVKKDFHWRAGGFDEKIWIAEDHDYARRIAKIGKYGFLLKPGVPLFLKRMQREGVLKTNLKYIGCNVINIFGITVKKDIFKYYFGQYNGFNQSKRKNGPIMQFLWYVIAYSLSTMALILWALILVVSSPLLLFNLLKAAFEKKEKSIKM